MTGKTQVAEKTENDVAVIETEIDEAEKIQPKKADLKSVAKTIPYFTDAKVTCACGNKFITGSTKKEIRVEVCSNCHPFFTGQEKFVDTEGRVERFKRMEDAKKETKSKKEVERKAEQPKTLKEMLLSMSEK